jgi:hypothetical protein
VLNDSVKCTYSFSTLNNRCTKTGTGDTTLLPTFYQPNECDEETSICINNNDDNPYGFCKRKIGAVCDIIYDCAPCIPENGCDPTRHTVVCDGTCNIIPFSFTNQDPSANYPAGQLFSICSYDYPCGNQLGCTNNENNFKNDSGICKLLNGNICSFDEQCLGGKCDVNNPGGPICISRIAPATACDIDYCQPGFGCDLISLPGENFCQPLIPDLLNPTISTPAVYGQKGSFCLIGAGPNEAFSCDVNAGLSCAFSLEFNGSSIYNPNIYPNLRGYGICQQTGTPANDVCTGNSGCALPNVCNNGVCGPPKYINLNDLNTAINDYNFCGSAVTNSGTFVYPTNGSSGQCEDGYTCQTITSTPVVIPGMVNPQSFCMANSGYICSSHGSPGTYGTYGNYCSQVGQTCGGKKLGVFIPNSPGSYLGVWRFISLPTGVVPTSKSKLSVYQSMPSNFDQFSQYPITRIIYYENDGVNLTNFYYTEISNFYFDPNGDNQINFTPFDSIVGEAKCYAWKNISLVSNNVNYTPNKIYDVKFSTAGNFAIFLNETGPIVFPFVPNVPLSNRGFPYLTH